jgi:hypothetical protein
MKSGSIRFLSAKRFWAAGGTRLAAQMTVESKKLRACGVQLIANC